MKYALLDLHSETAVELCLALGQAGHTLTAATFDSFTLTNRLKERIYLLLGKKFKYLEASHIWQKDFAFDKATNLETLEWASEAEIDAALHRARNAIYCWSIHREKMGRGLSEEEICIMQSTIIRNLLLFVRDRPDFVISIVAPHSPFDIGLAELCEGLGIPFYLMGEINIKGFFYITKNPFKPHAGIIPKRSNKSNRSENGGSLSTYEAVDAYASDVRNSRIYYADYPSVSLTESADSDSRLFEDLQRRHNQYMLQLRTWQPPRLHRSCFDEALQSFKSSRELKYDKEAQIQKEERRSTYLSQIEGQMVKEVAENAIIVALDYYPEVTRFPLGGYEYHWSNLLLAARLIRHKNLFGCSTSTPVYVKENYAMLVGSRHSHGRKGLVECINQNGFQMLSPFVKLTELLSDQRSRPQLLLAGVGNSGVEASLLGVQGVSISHPWWLSLPKTAHFNVLTSRILQKNNDSAECPRHSYTQWARDYCYDLGIGCAVISIVQEELSCRSKSIIGEMALAITDDIETKCQ